MVNRTAARNCRTITVRTIERLMAHDGTMDSSIVACYTDNKFTSLWTLLSRFCWFIYWNFNSQWNTLRTKFFLLVVCTMYNNWTSKHILIFLTLSKSVNGTLHSFIVICQGGNKFMLLWTRLCRFWWLIYRNFHFQWNTPRIKFFLFVICTYFYANETFLRSSQNNPQMNLELSIIPRILLNKSPRIFNVKLYHIVQTSFRTIFIPQRVLLFNSFFYTNFSRTNARETRFSHFESNWSSRFWTTVSSIIPGVSLSRFFNVRWRCTVTNGENFEELKWNRCDRRKGIARVGRLPSRWLSRVSIVIIRQLVRE